MLLVIAALVFGQSPTSPELVDVSEFRDNLELWTDGHGHYVAANGPDHVFYGDGKTFFAQDPFMTSKAGTAFQSQIRDPRYPTNDVLIRTEDGDKLTTVCGKRETQLAKMGSDAGKSMIAKALFKRRPHATRAYSLARDEHGVYYYVDRGRYEDNNGVYHVYIGPRGALAEAKLKNVVHDSAGDIFATPKGELRLIVSADTSSSEWVHGDKHQKLVDLPVDDNVMMIYNELGVYKHLRVGTPCDDL
jgi:hypothetical protein